MHTAQWKAARKADRELRSELAAGSRADLQAAGGNVSKALARLAPAGKSKATGKQKARAVRKNLKTSQADKLKLHPIGSGRKFLLAARQKLKDARQLKSLFKNTG